MGYNGLLEYENWTETAIQCYKSKFPCETCKLRYRLETLNPCRMKEAVMQLIRKFGLPEELKERTENAGQI